MDVKYLIGVLVFVVAALVSTLAALLSSGCAECKPEEFRCSGDVLEVCDDDERWKSDEQCKGVVDEWSRIWTCCDLGNGDAECTPVEECREDGGI